MIHNFLVFAGPNPWKFAEKQINSYYVRDTEIFERQQVNKEFQTFLIILIFLFSWDCNFLYFLIRFYSSINALLVIYLNICIYETTFRDLCSNLAIVIRFVSFYITNLTIYFFTLSIFIYLYIYVIHCLNLWRHSFVSGGRLAAITRFFGALFSPLVRYMYIHNIWEKYGKQKVGNR